MKPTLAVDYMLLLLVAAIWGTSFALIKVGVAQIGPVTLAAGRIVIAAIALTIWLVAIKKVKLPLSTSAISAYVVIGLLGNALPFTLIGWSELTLDSAMVAVLMGIMPVFTLVMAHFFLEDEPFSLRALIGISFGFAGLLVLLGFSLWRGTQSELVAQLIAIVASLCYASVTIYVRRYVTESGLEVATGALIAGSIFALIMAFAFENPTQMSWNLQAILPMTLLGLFPTALASVLYLYLVRRLGATRFAQINYIIPVFGSIVGFVFLGEHAHWRMWLALALVLSGIYLVHGARRGTPRVL